MIPLTQSFVISYIDKNAPEGTVMCPHAWGKVVEDFGNAMREVCLRTCPLW